MSATGKDAQVLDALLARVLTLTVGSPALPISYPEIAFDPATDAPEGKYLEVTFFPNRPGWEGVSSGVLDQGLLQITVVWPKGVGLVALREATEEVKAHFPKSLILQSGETRVKISAEPWTAPTIPEPDKVSAPVTIPWTA